MRAVSDYSVRSGGTRERKSHAFARATKIIRQAERRSGRDGDQRQIERARAMRVLEDLLGEIGTRAAAV